LFIINYSRHRPSRRYRRGETIFAAARFQKTSIIMIQAGPSEQGRHGLKSLNWMATRGSPCIVNFRPDFVNRRRVI
jgi:hypothetical protein